MSLGENIKMIRTDKGITQSELAEALNVTVRTIQNYESGNREPSIDTLTKIAEVLNVKISAIISDSKTLTNKLINYLDSTVYHDYDPLNTLELICELVDIDTDVISVALKNDEDISESYLVSMLNMIYEKSSNLFLDFYIENKELLNNKYLICKKRCDEILNEIKLKEIFGESVTYGDLISNIPTYTTNFKQQLCDYIKFNYKSNFSKFTEKDKLTDSELHYLYKKIIEYIDLLTERMKNEKQLININSTLNELEESTLTTHDDN